MRTTTLLCLILLGAFVSQAAFAVTLPRVFNTCYYSQPSPLRPDPRDPPLTTPEQRCAAADSFALSNVPTVPVGVIEPSGEPRYYCTLDGSTLASPANISDIEEQHEWDLADYLPGAIPCAGDAACVNLFGENATCKSFGPDASGRSDSGWASVGPASAITVASDLAGTLGAHSIYVRSTGGQGYIFYFQRGIHRTHSLAGGGDGNLPVLDITFCQAQTSPVIQLTQPPGCEGFFCRPIECCGPHFPCDGAPDLPPLIPEPEDRLAGIDLELEALTDNGGLHIGQAYGMRQRIVNIFNSLEEDNLVEACDHMDQFILSIGRNVTNGSLNPEAAGPLEAEATALRDGFGCA